MIRPGLSSYQHEIDGAAFAFKKDAVVLEETAAELSAKPETPTIQVP